EHQVRAPRGGEARRTWARRVRGERVRERRRRPVRLQVGRADGRAAARRDGVARALVAEVALGGGDQRVGVAARVGDEVLPVAEQGEEPVPGALGEEERTRYHRFEDAEVEVAAHRLVDDDPAAAIRLDPRPLLDVEREARAYGVDEGDALGVEPRVERADEA